MNAERKLPLEGVRVVDLGVVLAGPYGSMILGDLGAEVIRVESIKYFPAMTRGPMARPPEELIRKIPPISGGYPNRKPGQRPWNRFPWFNATARNKLGMTVDLRQDSGKAIFKKLVALSDVLITNQTPGTLDKLDLGYEALKHINPRLIFLEASSFGARGPYSSYRAMGLQMEAFAGHDLLRHYPHRDVTTNTWAVTADAAGALSIALASILALHARAKTGEGQYIDVSMVENFVGLIGHIVLDYTINGRVQGTLGNRDYYAIQGCYRCKGDDRWIVMTVCSDTEFEKLCELMGRTDLINDSRFKTAVKRYEHHNELDEIIEKWSSTKERDELVDLLWSSGLMAGPVLDDADAMANVHLRARGFFWKIYQEDTGEHFYPGSPFDFLKAKVGCRLPPVRLGEHNERIYKHLLGYSEEQYKEFITQGHIGEEFEDSIP